MDDDVVIRAENLGKKYVIQHEAGRNTHVVAYAALREVLARQAGQAVQSAKQLLRGERPSRIGASEEFWALKDISFDVGRGEVLGIIGRNGAGKSTLLKVLSRITEPTKGRVRIRGRVASLLEVGTGFHPELSGRENILLNGAILGMRRAEIRAKFDEIVAFAEVQKFIDTPVKRYSSGMYVRLAFAVAAHLEPEILIVDEVLAVGDLEFQKKCLGKMKEVSGRNGRTVLFVSHNMGAVANLCPRCILLAEGRIVIDGPSSEVIGRYANVGVNRQQIDHSKFEKTAALLSVNLVGDRVNGNSVFWSDDFAIEFHYRAAEIPGLEIAFDLLDRDGRLVFFSSSRHATSDDKAPGLFAATAEIPGRFLAPGNYSVTASLHQPNILIHDNIDNSVYFTIIGDAPEHYRFGNANLGVVTPDLHWNVERLQNSFARPPAILTETH